MRFNQQFISTYPQITVSRVACPATPRRLASFARFKVSFRKQQLLQFEMGCFNSKSRRLEVTGAEELAAPLNALCECKRRVRSGSPAMRTVFFDLLRDLPTTWLKFLTVSMFFSVSKHVRQKFRLTFCSHYYLT